MNGSERKVAIVTAVVLAAAAVLRAGFPQRVGGVVEPAHQDRARV